MDSIIKNTINSYDYVNNTNIAVQSTKNDTFGSNATTQTTTVGDTIEISSGTNNFSAFSKTIDEVSSENELFPCVGGYMTAQTVFFLEAEIMKDQGYNVPSFDNNCTSYSDFIDKMKSFISSDPNTPNSSQLIDFCDDLKERLNMYGIH